MSTIDVIDRQIVGYNVQEIGNKLSTLSSQASVDMLAAEGRLDTLEATSGALDWKNSVVLATTGALPANTRTGNVLLADANGLLGTIDGVDTATLTLPFRLGVKNEATGANNGPYSVTSIGGASAKWTMTRTTDADSSAEVTPNMAFLVERGSANQDKIFYLDIDGPVTLNTTTLTFVDWRGIAITAPADVTKAAAAVGTSTTLARSDHKHDVATGAPAAISIGDSQAEGTASSLARSDHVHRLTAPAAPADVTKAAAAAGTAAEPARADHKHDISTAATLDVALANAEGTATSLARSDHTHNSLNQRFQLTLVAGTATKAAGVVVTANTRAAVSLVTPGAGVSGTRYAFAYGIGGAGVGTIAVTAKDSAAGDNTVNTDVSVLDIITWEAAAV